MTKKFWADWQKRIGETTQIYIIEESVINGNKYRFSNALLKYHPGFRTMPNKYDEIIKATFNGDIVTLIIKQYYSFFHNRRYCLGNTFVEITLKRTDIDSVSFYR